MAPRRTSDVPAFLSAGPLVLATGPRVLTGPIGTTELHLAPYSVLRPLMMSPGSVVSSAHLIETAWPDADLECDVPEAALLMRVSRAKDALERVGGSRSWLRCRRGDGYVLEAGAPRVVRSYTPEQVKLLDRIVAAWPDRAAAAELAPLFSHVHAPVAEVAYAA